MISTAWQVVNVNNEIARKKLSNMEIPEVAKNALCVCNGEWQERERERESN